MWVNVAPVGTQYLPLIPSPVVVAPSFRRSHDTGYASCQPFLVLCTTPSLRVCVCTIIEGSPLCSVMAKTTCPPQHTYGCIWCVCVCVCARALGLGGVGLPVALSPCGV